MICVSTYLPIYLAAFGSSGKEKITEITGLISAPVYDAWEVETLARSQVSIFKKETSLIARLDGKVL